MTSLVKWIFSNDFNSLKCNFANNENACHWLQISREIFVHSKGVCPSGCVLLGSAISKSAYLFRLPSKWEEGNEISAGFSAVLDRTCYMQYQEVFWSTQAIYNYALKFYDFDPSTPSHLTNDNEN